MDPNATLADIRWTISEFYQGNKDINLGELIALIDDLDNWLAKGGFLPEAWRKKPWMTP